nr:zinc finger, CCHC-type [Tanacetum cinerariifolium]
MKGYLDYLEHLGYHMPQELEVSLKLNSLSKDYEKFVQTYNMHCMRKTMAELHVMLKLLKKGIPKKVVAPVILTIRKGKIQKKNKPQGAMGKGNERNRECDNCWVKRMEEIN